MLQVFRWVLDFLRRRGRSVGLPREEQRQLLRDEADYFGLLGLVDACDQVPRSVTPLVDELRSVSAMLGSILMAVDESTKSSAVHMTKLRQEIIIMTDRLGTAPFDPDFPMDGLDAMHEEMKHESSVHGALVTIARRLANLRPQSIPSG